MARSPRAKPAPARRTTSETGEPAVMLATPAAEAPPRSEIDEQFERFRTHGAEAVEMAADQLNLARQLIVEQVKARPLASAAAAVGVGVCLGLFLAGPRR
jgi:ElaB/YqjD/DUF883 family membrane-anchored ribosome-binding protein